MKAFRPLYGKLGDLRSLLGHTPVICLTATATIDQQHHIMKLLGMDNPVIIKSPPIKKNITYHVIPVETDIDDNFSWLRDYLLKQTYSAPRILIFFRRVKHLSDVYEFLCDVLPRDLHVLFQMYYMKTEETVKKNILNSFMDTNGHVRIVLCSTSFSMGLDLCDVPYVVHYGPSNDLSSSLFPSKLAIKGFFECPGDVNF